jgi:hypothetical protein
MTCTRCVVWGLPGIMQDTQCRLIAADILAAQQAQRVLDIFARTTACTCPQPRFEAAHRVCRRDMDNHVVPLPQHFEDGNGLLYQ